MVRDHEEVTAVIIDANYPTIEDDLVNTTELEGDRYEQDAQRVWGLLEPLVRKGPVWNYFRAFKKERQGRKGFLAAKTQATGQAAHQNRKDEAYEIIRKENSQDVAVFPSKPTSTDTKMPPTFWRRRASQFLKPNVARTFWMGSPIQLSLKQSCATTAM